MGHVRKTTQGRWEAVWQVGHGRAAQRRSRTFDLKGQATAFLAQVKADLLRGDYVDPSASRVTFSEYAEHWLSRRVGRPGTLLSYKYALARLTLGDVQMGHLTRAHVERQVSDLSERYAPGTVRHTYHVLAMLMRDAVRDRVIPRSPCQAVRLPEQAKHVVDVLSPEQVFRLIDVSREPAMLALGYGCGLRQGEVLGLRRGSVDFLRRTLRVSEQAVDGKLGPPKTRASSRVVPMPQLVVDLLARHLEEHPSDGLLFHAPKGGTWRRSNFNGQVWKPALKAAGLDEALGFHVLRHTYVSHLLAQGENVKVIQERLGHASIQETMDTYGHLMSSAEQGTRDAIDGLMAKVRNGPGAGEKRGHPL